MGQNYCGEALCQQKNESKETLWFSLTTLHQSTETIALKTCSCIWHYEYVPLLGAQFFGCLGVFTCMQWKYHSTSSPSPCWKHCGGCLSTASIPGAYYMFLLLSSRKFLISFFPRTHFGALGWATWSPRTSRWGSHYFWRFAMWWIAPLVEKERAAIQWTAFLVG